MQPGTRCGLADGHVYVSPGAIGTSSSFQSKSFE